METIEEISIPDTKYKGCEYCNCVSSLGSLITKLPGDKKVSCPGCRVKNLTKSARRKWLAIPVVIILLEYIIYNSSNVEFLYFLVLFAWYFVFAGFAIICHEIAHCVVTRILGGICPVVTFGEGTALFSIKTKETLWQFCPSPTLGLAYCVYPPDKQVAWKWILTLIAGGLANLVIAILSFVFALYLDGESRFSPFLFVNGIVNALFFVYAVFVPSRRPGLKSDGQQILSILREKNSFFGEKYRQHQIVIALALLAREKPEELYDYIRGCEDFENSAMLCHLLSYCHYLRFESKEFLYWARRSLALLESRSDNSIPEGDEGLYINAIVENNIAFALYSSGSTNCEELKSLAESAFDKAPWESAIIGTYAAVKIRCGDVSEGIELLEKKISEEKDTSTHNLAMNFITLAEGYKKINRLDDMRRSLEKAREIDPDVFNQRSFLVEAAISM